MGLRGHLRARGLVALGGLVGALALLVAWSFGIAMHAEAHTPHEGLNFTIEAEGSQTGCSTSQGDAVCYVLPGSTFTLDVMLASLGDIPSYEGYDIVVDYTGLTSADDASSSSWPSCGFPAQFFQPGKVAIGCTIGLPPAGASTYTGVIATNSFTCSNSGTITLHHGSAYTILTEAVGVQHAEATDSRETLNITCGVAPTPTSTVPPTPGQPTALPGTGTGGADQDGGTGAGLWVAIGVLLTVAIAGAGVFGWRFARVAR